MKKIKTGIYGLSSLLYGGFIRNSTTVVIGKAGAGKTTFSLQFIRKGLEYGQEAVFVSLDENKEQILQEAVAMGWSEILEYVDNKLLSFIDASGKDFANFIKSELPAFVEDWMGSDMRIAIDPLTPVLWSIKEEYEQRELIGTMLKQMKNIGTVVCTLEEYGAGDLGGREVVIPMYLADCVIHLRYERSGGGRVRRNLEIVKCRNSRHSDMLHPYIIVRGFGLIVGKGDFNTDKHNPLTKEQLEKIECAGLLPKHQKEKIGKALGELIEDDIKNFQKDEFVRAILEEYTETWEE